MLLQLFSDTVPLIHPQVPHLWIGARDACKFASAHTIIGSSLANGSSDVNAVLGAGVKLSTGKAQDEI